MRLTGNGDGFQAPANAEERSKQVGVRAPKWNCRRREGQSARREPPTPTATTKWPAVLRTPRPGSQELSTMNSTMLQPDPHAVKHQRFVAATEAQQADLERQIGRNLYKRGKRIEECVTDEMTQGYMDAEWAGYMAYSRHMEAEGVPAAQAFAFEGCW